MYELKKIPEDFIVEEIPDRNFEESGKYSVYLLKKTNYNTEDAVEQICRYFGIQRKNVTYAGTKDRNAITSQYITLLGKVYELELKDISLKHKGFTNTPISLGNLNGNKFTITVRNIFDEKIKVIDKFVNYFDSQRFSKNNAEIGKFIIMKKYKDACDLLISENSRNSELIKDSLQKHNNAYLNALKLIPKKTLLIYLHAYQSLLWNNAAEKLIQKSQISQKDTPEKLSILGFGTELEGESGKIYNEILLNENISLRDFILRDFPEVSLEGDSRKIMVQLNDLEISGEEEDELNPGKKKFTVDFFLQKGAYATMAVKNIVEEK